jgi:hypothetical protein
VISLPHPTRHIPHTHRLSVTEFSKLITFDGFGLYGAPAKVWREEGLLDEAMKLQSKKMLTIKSLFMTEFDEEKCFYYVAVLRGGG